MLANNLTLDDEEAVQAELAQLRDEVVRPQSEYDDIRKIEVSLDVARTATGATFSTPANTSCSNTRR